MYCKITKNVRILFRPQPIVTTTFNPPAYYLLVVSSYNIQINSWISFRNNRKIRSCYTCYNGGKIRSMGRETASWRYRQSLMAKAAPPHAMVPRAQGSPVRMPTAARYRGSHTSSAVTWVSWVWGRQVPMSRACQRKNTPPPKKKKLWGKIYYIYIYIFHTITVHNRL